MQPNQSWSTRTCTPSRLGGEGVCELVTDLVVGDDVVVQVDPTLCLGDGLKPIVVGIGPFFSSAILLPSRSGASLTRPRIPSRRAPREAAYSGTLRSSF